MNRNLYANNVERAERKINFKFVKIQAVTTTSEFAFLSLQTHTEREREKGGLMRLIDSENRFTTWNSIYADRELKSGIVFFAIIG